jgi:RNA polymerase sigma-70 factor (ECF subfamily)
MSRAAHSARPSTPPVAAATTDTDVRASATDDARWTTLRQALARAVRRQCPQWLSDHAEDLVQSALIKVMTMPGAGEGTRGLSSFYLYRVAHSALVDEIRRRRRRREVSLEVDDPQDSQSLTIEPKAAGTPEQDAALRELGSALRECLLSMSDDRRQAVTLYIQGHSVPEAARILGWPAKRTENLVYRGLADLRLRLKGKGHAP